MRLFALLLLLTASCAKQDETPPDNSDAKAEAQAAPVVPQAPAAPKQPAVSAVKVEEKTDLYTFSFAWPAEAAAIPKLAERFKAEMEKAKAELTRDASSDRDERKKGGFPFHAYELQRSYETAGQSDRLLSLESSVYSFTGGAHGSTGSGSLIWDRQAAKEVSIPDLLIAGQSWTGAITQAFCVLLNREREKRRGAPVEPGSTFGDCPKYNELTKVLRDTNSNGRFDHVGVIADQYVAGPYAEGDFDIPLPITATMIGRIKPEYRSSFEARPGVK
jgi:hypothetical protein